MESLPPGMNNLFRGTPIFQEDEMHEHMKMSLLPGRRTTGNLTCHFDPFSQVFERGLLQKIFDFDRKEWPFKAG